MDYTKLIKTAFEAREKSYSPYSGFQVGAALLDANGKIHTGCNIENSSFSMTICAERTAFFKAISEDIKDFTAIAIVGGKKDGEIDFCPPCGACRQVMSEFCNSDNFKIILAVSENEYKVLSLYEIFPLTFELK